jgi:DNA-binding NarL/FixJ family response regulator
MEKINLVVVDDHPMTLMGMKLILKGTDALHIKLCGCYESGKELLHHIKDKQVDVVIIDLAIPDINGVDLIDRLLEINPDYKIGIYSSFEEKNIIIRAFEKGVIGYLSKESPNINFIDFINTLSRGDPYVRGKIATLLLNNNRENHNYHRVVRLTEREKEVITMIMGGITSREIASKLFISERTVEFHRRNIYAKFEVKNVIGLVNSLSKNSNAIVFS